MLPHIQFFLAISTWVRLRRLGGWGLVLLGVADNSVIPLTGSMDVLTIWLALDPVDEQNGCLRYVAGSHRRGIE